MDVAKYVLTAVIISTIFKEMQDKWMYVIATQHHRNHDIQFGIVVLTQQKRGGLI